MSVTTRTDIKGISRFLFTEGTDADRLHLHVSEVGPGPARPPATPARWLGDFLRHQRQWRSSVRRPNTSGQYG